MHILVFTRVNYNTDTQTTLHSKQFKAAIALPYWSYAVANTQPNIFS